MKNLLTSLKKLGKKMTGNDVTGTDLVTVVDNIADGYTGGGGSGGDGNVVIVDFTYEQVGFTSYYHSSLTIGEMVDLLESGKVLIGRSATTYGADYLTVDNYQHHTEDMPGGAYWSVMFQRIAVAGDNAIVLHSYSPQTGNLADSNTFIEHNTPVNGVVQ